MGQKSQLSQDMFLLGPPGPLKRRLVMTMAELCNWEVEYLHISKDTAESDIKQRREIIGSSSLFIDQAPVRAAIHGRVLVLDGMENAERNVLPTINNLLENREMSLEDGRYLLKQETYDSIMSNNLKEGSQQLVENANNSKLVPVHPNFRVIALSCPVPPYAGRTIDPPLRSRFQCRYIDELATSTVLNNISQTGVEIESNKASFDSLKRLAEFYESLKSLRNEAAASNTGTGAGVMNGIPMFSYLDLQYCYKASISNPQIPLKKIVNSVVPVLFDHNSRTTSSFHGLLTPKYIETINNMISLLGLTSNSTTLNSLVSTNCADELEIRPQSMLLDSQKGVLRDMVMAHEQGKHLCVLGTKVSVPGTLPAIYDVF